MKLHILILSLLMASLSPLTWAADSGRDKQRDFRDVKSSRSSGDQMDPREGGLSLRTSGKKTSSNPDRTSADEMKLNPSSKAGRGQGADQFRLEIEKSQSNMKDGPGDYGGTDDLKERILQLRKRTAAYLSKLRSAGDIEKLFKARQISQPTLDALMKELKTADSENPAPYGLRLRVYLMGIKFAFIEAGCPQDEVADYPMAFRRVGNAGYVCVSRQFLRENNYSDEQLISFLLHETLHFMGLRDHMSLQDIGDELAAVIASQIENQKVPECRINAKGSIGDDNALINETVPKCHLRVKEGDFIISFYSTKFGKGFRLNDDPFFMVKQDIELFLHSSWGTPALNTVDLTKICPAQDQNLSLADTIEMFSNRQIYAKILFDYWSFTPHKTAVVGVSAKAMATMMQQINNFPYLNFSIRGTGVGNPSGYEDRGYEDLHKVFHHVCLVPLDSLN